MIVAHPDDETVAAGGELSEWSDRVWIAHATDGAPEGTFDYEPAGCLSLERYREVRRRELELAMAMAGIEEHQLIRWDFPDLKLAWHLTALIGRVIPTVMEIRPAVIITHPYEGGHPDHDSVAFAVHEAIHYLDKRQFPLPLVIEAPFYHSTDRGDLIFGNFLGANLADWIIALSPEQRGQKKRLLGCYKTQTPVLKYFPTDIEIFRLAPDYDFSERPHSGQLWYERQGWISFDSWRNLVGWARGEIA